MSTTITNPNSRLDLIEGKIDKAVVSQLSVSRSQGGIVFNNATDIMEFAKMMAISGEAVRKHCRGQPGVCLGISIQAFEWGMNPYAVANKSYVVNDQICYEAQLINAVIERRAPITCRLKHSYSGSGDSRKCKVWAFVKGEEHAFEYESPEIGKLSPKNSPLWKTKPDLQLFYNTSRDWARMYFPDVLLGVYADDEIIDATPIKKVTVNSLNDLAERFTANAQEQEPIDNAPETPEEPPQSNPSESPNSSTEPPAQFTSPNLDKLAIDLQSVDSISDVNALRSKFIADDPDEDAVKNELCDAAIERIKGSRGANSNGKGGK